MKTIPCLLFSFLLTCFLLTGCYTDSEDYISKYCPGSCTIIKGRLTTANGTRPIPETPVIIVWEDQGFMGGSTRKKGITHTDANGNYELRFLIRDDELADGDFVVEPGLDASNYVYCRFDVLNFHFYELKRDTTLIADYNIPEKAFIEFKLGNPDALQTGDRFTANFTYSFGNDQQELCGNSIQWIHTYKNNQIVEVAADQPLFLEQIRLKNGIETKEQITLQLQPGETKVMSINF